MFAKLLSLEALWAGLGHITRWIILPAIVLGLVAIGFFFVSDDAVSVTLRSNIASLVSLFIAVTVTWLCSRWLDWLSKTRFKTDVAPLLKTNPLALSVYYTGRWVGLCFLVATVLATVRF